MKRVGYLIMLLLSFSLLLSACGTKNEENEVTSESDISRVDTLGGWGPDRKTFTMDNPSDYVVFNSITDNPVLGDERNFVRIAEADSGTTYRDNITIEPGKTYELYIGYHNNAKSSLNQSGSGIARGVMLAVQYPTSITPSKPGEISAILSAANAVPEEIWDGVRLTSNEEITLRYVVGSAKIYNSWETNGQTLSTEIFSEKGTYLGLNEFDGLLPGCAEYSGHILIKFNAEPSTAVSKNDTSYIDTPRGPERQTFTMESPAEYPVFNSIINNPTIGDERDFVRVGEINPDTTNLQDCVELIPGKQYLVYIYIHNNASSILNDSAHNNVGVAWRSRVSSAFPEIVSHGETSQATAIISAENTNPISVWDCAYLSSSNGDIRLSYVAGSAKIHSDWEANGTVLPSSLFSDEGVLIGLNELNGVIPGCEEYHCVISYVLQAD